jgi:hypothetical protein
VVKGDQGGLIEDAQVHGLGVQVDAGVKWMPLSVKSHHGADLLVSRDIKLSQPSPQMST